MKQLIEVSRFDLFIAFLIIFYTLLVFADLLYEDIKSQSSTTTAILPSNTTNITNSITNTSTNNIVKIQNSSVIKAFLITEFVILIIFIFEILVKVYAHGVK